VHVSLVRPDELYMPKAEMLIVEFELRTGPTAFPNVDKKSFVRNLRERLKDPSTINQGISSLCGPAVVLYCWLIKRPDLFTLYVINVFENGTGMMGYLRVTPHKGCRTFKPAQKTTPDDNIVDVDWIALGALRDSENGFFRYSDESKQIAGITIPETISEWFEKISFKVVQMNADWKRFEETTAYKALLEAIGHFKANRSVCLLINAKRVFKGDLLTTLANHWVVMTSEPMIGNTCVSLNTSLEAQLARTIAFDVYTWGDKTKSINFKRSQDMTVQDFLSGFYGYVAVEFDPSSPAYGKFSLMSEQMSNSPILNPWKIKGIYN
jgi:hypothetical protein